MLVIRETTQTTENLSELRRQIDELDNSIAGIIGQTDAYIREIGQYKKEHDMTVLQPTRYDEILSKRINQAIDLDMDGEFMKSVLQAIHEESVRQQMNILNK